jgi:hypothetical protein
MNGGGHLYKIDYKPDMNEIVPREFFVTADSHDDAVTIFRDVAGWKNIIITVWRDTRWEPSERGVPA